MRGLAMKHRTGRVAPLPRYALPAFYSLPEKYAGEGRIRGIKAMEVVPPVLLVDSLVPPAVRLVQSQSSYSDPPPDGGRFAMPLDTTGDQAVIHLGRPGCNPLLSHGLHSGELMLPGVCPYSIH